MKIVSFSFAALAPRVAIVFGPCVDAAAVTTAATESNYYNERYIWPVEFRSSRLYNSYMNVDDRVEYVSEILDGGPMGPIFKVGADVSRV
jgi:hypothetical protein